MKIALVTDDHFGVRNDSTVFADNLDKFYAEVFWPYIDEHRITEIFHLGDLGDRRKFMSFQTAHRLRHSFTEQVAKRPGLSCTIIVGNHDAPLRNSLEYSGPLQLIPTRGYWWPSIPRIKIITKPHQYSDMLFVPWICEANRDVALAMIERSEARFVFGHFELVGFEMDRGRVADKGLSLDFSKFKGVYSGHYHHKSSKGNVHYLGATREQTWADVGDPKGFHTFDINTGEIEFIRNPHTVFFSMQYGKYVITRYDKLAGKIIRITIEEDTECTPTELENFVQDVARLGPADLRVVDKRHKKKGPTVENPSTDMLDMLVEAANEEQENKDTLRDILTDLYREARDLEQACLN